MFSAFPPPIEFATYVTRRSTSTVDTTLSRDPVTDKQHSPNTRNRWMDDGSDGIKPKAKSDHLLKFDKA